MRIYKRLNELEKCEQHKTDNMEWENQVARHDILQEKNTISIGVLCMALIILSHH